PAEVEGHAPVEADDISAGRRHDLEQVPRTGPKVDRWGRDAAENALRIGRDELLIVLNGKRAHPTVEELNHIRTGLHLRADVAKERLTEPLHELMPDLGRPVHAALRLHELARRPALDQV